MMTCVECDGSGGEDETCSFCEGSGNHRCESRGCSQIAVGFNDDGKALCEDCVMDWTMGEGEA